MSSASTRARQRSTPEEIEVHYKKRTNTELDELGVELETLTNNMPGCLEHMLSRLSEAKCKMISS